MEICEVHRPSCERCTPFGLYIDIGAEKARGKKQILEVISLTKASPSTTDWCCCFRSIRIRIEILGHFGLTALGGRSQDWQAEHPEMAREQVGDLATRAASRENAG